MVDYFVEVVLAYSFGESAKYASGVAFLVVFDRQSFLILWSVFRMRVISLRLRIAFIRMIMKALKSPEGFLGGLPGPLT